MTKSYCPLLPIFIEMEPSLRPKFPLADGKTRGFEWPVIAREATIHRRDILEALLFSEKKT